MDGNLSLRIVGGNAAFQENPHAEYARILRHLADAVEAGREGRFYLYDLNGNPVGRACLEIWPDEEAD